MGNFRVTRSSSFALEDPSFNNVLEVVASPRPHIMKAGFAHGKISDHTNYLDDKEHYKNINGKLGIHAEL